MKTSNKTTVLLITATLALSVVAATLAQKARQLNEKMWESISEGSVDRAGKRQVVPTAYRTFRLDKAALAQLLASAPMEFTQDASRNPIIELPMPDGTLARFRFEESPVVEPGLAAQYPELKTYRAQGIDDPTATSRFDWLPRGFHGIILAASGTVFIDPYAEGNTTDYISYWKKDAVAPERSFECPVNGPSLPQLPNRAGVAPNVASDAKLRTYRLALAATHEYAADMGDDTIEGTLAAEVLVMNRVNAIFEREVAIHLNIIDSNANITYASDQSCGGVPCTNENDPYTNTNCFLQLEENHENLPDAVGSANYDIGHVFSTCGNGYGELGSVCSSWPGTAKERGSSGEANPAAPGATKFVAHELGHQFSTHHSFNGCDTPQWNATSAYEPGSGITLMSYLGSCASQDLDHPNKFMDIFTVKGLEDIIGFSQSLDGTCGVVTNTWNAPPTVTGPGNFTIPKQTPFTLTGSANDFDRGVTSGWEEYDLGPQTTATPNSDADGNPRPILRLYTPNPKGVTRTFPSLQYILNNANVPPTHYNANGGIYLTGELLPAIPRVMVFKMVARDNRANGGGVSSVQSSVTIDGTAAPFAVTSPNTAIAIPRLTNFNVTWNASGNAANVKISLSTNGGNTFPTVLAASTPNDGAHSVFIPDMPTSTARIKIEAVGNIYFDISNTNFSIITDS